MPTATQRDNGGGTTPLIAHIIFRLGVGGLENGLVNLINRLPSDRFRHVIICVKGATSFAGRIERSDVEVVEIKKRDGKDPATYYRIWKALRRLRPDIVHTRNANTIEYQFVAALAGVRRRVHGEHGWDVHDLHGRSRKYRWLRRLASPVVDQFITVSEQLRDYLVESVGIARSKVHLIYNGVDSERFRADSRTRGQLRSSFAIESQAIVVGTVGRMQRVKNPMLLAKAFFQILDADPRLNERLRLFFIGDGPLKEEIMRAVRDAALEDSVWFAGERDDIPGLLTVMDIFVLPSLNEGVSNTVLEAMSCSLPVVGTRVGGTPEIVDNGCTGQLVDSEDVNGMAAAILEYVRNESKRTEHGAAGRLRVLGRFSLDRMVGDYQRVYDSLLSCGMTSTGKGF